MHGGPKPGLRSAQDEERSLLAQRPAECECWASTKKLSACFQHVSQFAGFQEFGSVAAAGVCKQCHAEGKKSRIEEDIPAGVLKQQWVHFVSEFAPRFNFKHCQYVG